jgi:DNA-binding response OmpR family regulator
LAHAYRGTVNAADHEGFEFDYNHSTILCGGNAITLSPPEADILRVLLNNRARPTPIGTRIQKVYGANEPDAAAVSIRVAILDDDHVIAAAAPRIACQSLDEGKMT